MVEEVESAELLVVDGLEDDVEERETCCFIMAVHAAEEVQERHLERG